MTDTCFLSAVGTWADDQEILPYKTQSFTTVVTRITELNSRIFNPCKKTRNVSLNSTLILSFHTCPSLEISTFQWDIKSKMLRIIRLYVTIIYEDKPSSETSDTSVFIRQMFMPVLCDAWESYQAIYWFRVMCTV